MLSGRFVHWRDEKPPTVTTTQLLVGWEFAEMESASVREVEELHLFCNKLL